MLVSVIIPTYNRGRYLLRSIKSVLSQNYNNLEIKICDNGSSDGSRDVVQNINHFAISWLDGAKFDKSPSTMRNLGMRNSTGEVIMFLDSDDFWHPGHILKTLKFLDKYDAVGEFTKTHFFKDSFTTYQKLALSNIIKTSSVGLKRSLLAKIGFFPEIHDNSIYEDYAFWLRVASKARFFVTNTNFVFYEDSNPESLSKKVFSNHLNLSNTYKDFEFWSLNARVKLSQVYYFFKFINLSRARLSKLKHFFYKN